MFKRFSQYLFAVFLFATKVSTIAAFISLCVVVFFRLFKGEKISSLDSYLGPSLMMSFYVIAIYFPCCAVAFTFSILMRQYFKWRPTFNEGYLYLGLVAAFVSILLAVVFKLGLAGVTSLLATTIPTLVIGTRIYHQIWKRLLELLDSKNPIEEPNFSSSK